VLCGVLCGAFMYVCVLCTYVCGVCGVKRLHSTATSVLLGTLTLFRYVFELLCLFYVCVCGTLTLHSLRSPSGMLLSFGVRFFCVHVCVCVCVCVGVFFLCFASRV